VARAGILARPAMTTAKIETGIKRHIPVDTKSPSGNIIQPVSVLHKLCRIDDFNSDVEIARRRSRVHSCQALQQSRL